MACPLPAPRPSAARENAPSGLGEGQRVERAGRGAGDAPHLARREVHAREQAAAHSNAETNVKTQTVGIDDNDDVEGNFGYVGDPPPPPSDLHLKLENLVDGYAGDVPAP